MMFVRCLLLAGLLTGLTAVPARALPPADPNALTTITLDNALEVWVHPAPQQAQQNADRQDAGSETGIWLVVRAGPLAEHDDQAGAAYLLKRAAGLGTPNAPAPALEPLRTRFGRPARAHPASEGWHALLAHEGVVYTLVIDTDDADAWDRALAHYADLLSGWAPEDHELDRARVMAAERLGAMSPDERARRAFIPDIFTGQRLGARHTIPPEDRLAATTNERVREFARATYRPSNATLIVVGDIDPGQALSRVRRAMQRVPDTGPAPDITPGVSEPVAGRVSAHAVEGYEPAEVSLLAITPAQTKPDPTSLPNAPAPRDPAAHRVFDALAAELVLNRVRPAAALGDAGVFSVETAVKPWIDASRIAEISIRVESPGLASAGRAVAAELARVHAGGFSDAELRAARAAVLDRFDRDAADWRTASPETILNALAIAARTNARAPQTARWIAPADLAAAASRVLASTTNADLTTHARAAFDPRALACILVSPDTAAPPHTDTARAILTDAARPATPARTTTPERLWSPEAPGEVRQISHDAVTGVWTGVLSNGVLVRARRTPDADKALVRLTLADGVAREDAGTLGRTRDAALAWRYPRTPESDAAGVRAWSLARGLTARVTIAEHLLTLGIDADTPAGLGNALTLAAATLAGAGIDHRYTPRVRIEQPDFGPGIRRLGELLLAPDDPRARKAPAPDTVDPDLADAWLRTLTRAPIEVALVGDFAPEDALRLAAETLGSLPARAEPSRQRHTPWSELPAAATVERLRAPDAEPEALLGVVFADASDLQAVRPMIVAAAAVHAELNRLLNDGGTRAKARAWVWLGDGIPDRVALVVRCENAADPAAALEAIDLAIERVATGASDAGVLEREIAKARDSVGHAWDQPAFWADRLSRLAVHGMGIDSIAGMHASYDAITPDSVRAALRAAVTDGVHKRVLVLPE